MRVYLAGPMTGLPDHNFPAFEHWARQLRLAGYDVVSPRELSGPLGAALQTPWELHLRRDLRAMLQCEGVVVLDGWGRSRGALLEVETARRVGMPVYQARRTGPEPTDLELEELEEASILEVFAGMSRAADFERTLERINETVQASGVREEFEARVAQLRRDGVAIPIVMPGSAPLPGVVVDPLTGAMKADGQKPRTDLIPPQPLLDIAAVFEFGSRKYEDRNWERGFAWGRPYGALLRHLLQWWGGQDLDEETGLSHLAHAGCDLLMLLEFTHSLAGTDDRPYHEGDHE